jgi:hypothetical protein
MTVLRYLLTALIAEVIALGVFSSKMHNTPAALWRQTQIYNSEPHSNLMPIQYADTDRHIFEWQHKEMALSEQAHALALQLDLFDGIPYLIVAPVLSSFALWTIDRRRKQKAELSKLSRSVLRHHC